MFGNMGWQDWAKLGGNLLGMYLNYDSAKDAGKMQSQAAAEAIAEQRRQFDQLRADQEPWRQAGVGALGQMTGLMAPGGEFNRNYTWQDIASDPIFAQTYQAGLDKGTNALMRQLSAGGNRNSGAAAKALTRYASDYANQTGQDALNRIWQQQGNRYNRLAGLAGTGQAAVNQLGAAGQNYANNVGNIGMSSANARGASRIAQGNAWSQGLSDLFNWYQQQQLVDALRNQ